MAGDLTEMREGSKEITHEDKKLLYERVQLLKHDNALLLKENNMFERFISRLDPRDLEPQPEGEDLGAMSVSPMEGALTLEQKCYVGQREMEETLKDLEKVKRTQENYKASLEEAEIRLAEIRKARAEFEQDVAIPLREKKGWMMGADKVLRYFENKRRAKDTEVEKLRQKNGVLKAHVRKLQLQLRQKAEMAEDMTELDFQQLKIENSQCLEQIDEQNQELSQLKLLAVNKQQALNSYKKKLQSVTYESQQLSSDITNRMEMLAKIEKESLQVEEERLKAEALNRKLRNQMGNNVPDILEYIQVKDKHSKLERSVRAMERKVKIAEMALRTQRRAWDKQRAVVAAMDLATSSHKAGPGAGAGAGQLLTAQKTHTKAWNKQGAAAAAAATGTATSSHDDGAGAEARPGEGQLKLPYIAQIKTMRPTRD